MIKFKKKSYPFFFFFKEIKIFNFGLFNRTLANAFKSTLRRSGSYYYFYYLKYYLENLEIIFIFYFFYFFFLLYLFLLKRLANFIIHCHSYLQKN